MHPTDFSAQSVVDLTQPDSLAKSQLKDLLLGSSYPQIELSAVQKPFGPFNTLAFLFNFF